MLLLWCISSTYEVHGLKTSPNLQKQCFSSFQFSIHPLFMPVLFLIIFYICSCKLLYLVFEWHGKMVNMCIWSMEWGLRERIPYYSVLMMGWMTMMMLTRELVIMSSLAIYKKLSLCDCKNVNCSYNTLAHGRKECTYDGHVSAREIKHEHFAFFKHPIMRWVKSIDVHYEVKCRILCAVWLTTYTGWYPWFECRAGVEDFSFFLSLSVPVVGWLQRILPCLNKKSIHI